MRGALTNSGRIGILCCLLRFSPVSVVSFVSSPPLSQSANFKSSAAYYRREPLAGRIGQTPAVETIHFRGKSRAARGGATNSCGCWRGEAGDILQRRRANPNQRQRFVRSGGPLASSRQDEFISGEIESREEFEAWRAAAAEARGASGGEGSSPGDAAAVPTASVTIEQVYSARASPPGIDWGSLLHTVLDQLLFLAFFAWLATSTIRAQVRSLFLLKASAVAWGALAAVPMFVYGLFLDTRHWPWLETPRTPSARGDERGDFFGRTRQVAKVTAVSIPLAVLVGFCEECVYRGFFPLLLASKTRLPLAATVGLSAVFCGARHAGTLSDGIDAAVLGVYVHCLLLSTGSILVPIVAHAVFDAVLLVAEHVDESRPQKA
eukprot:g12655.t1